MKKLFFALALLPAIISQAAFGATASIFERNFATLRSYTSKNTNLKQFFLCDPDVFTTPRPYKKESDITFVYSPKEAASLEKFLVVIENSLGGHAYVWLLTNQEGRVVSSWDIFDLLGARARGMFTSIFHQASLQENVMDRTREIFIGFVCFVDGAMFIVEDDTLHLTDYKYDAWQSTYDWFCRNLPSISGCRRALYYLL